jgi:hypothetical protein
VPAVGEDREDQRASMGFSLPNCTHKDIARLDSEATVAGCSGICYLKSRVTSAARVSSARDTVRRGHRLKLTPMDVVYAALELSAAC